MFVFYFLFIFIFFFFVVVVVVVVVFLLSIFNTICNDKPFWCNLSSALIYLLKSMFISLLLMMS